MYFDINNFKYISSDKIIDNGVCGKERPDFLFEANSKGHYVIVEVDEKQHSGNLEACECSRMVNISQSLGMPTIFIRYNPDEYKVNKQRKDPSHNKRMKTLDLVVRNAMKYKPENLTGFVMMKKLFFNEYNEANCNYYNVLNFNE